MKFSVSTAKNKSEQTTAFSPKEVSSVKEFADIALSSDISTSVFRDNYRNIQNFDYAECIGLDIDNDEKKGTPVLPIADTKKYFGNFKHAILTSKSHQKAKHDDGKIADRYRVILFLSEPIRSANDFYATWYWLKDQFPHIDNQCKDPSRFWSKHSSIYSINEDGDLISPIRYTEPIKPSVDSREPLPGECGELSKDTLKLLTFGVEAGSRNGSVYKAAKDFQQNLYEYEYAKQKIMDSLTSNGLFEHGDFTEDEAEIAIRSAYSKDAKHAPRLSEIKQRAFNYIRLNDLFTATDKQEDWLVQGLLITGGMSMIIGQPKCGKTTLVRQLEKAVALGEDFLGMKTKQGLVMHFSFDEKARTTKLQFQKLGMSGNENILLHFGEINSVNYLTELEEDIKRLSPKLVVIDTMFDMVEANDINNYGELKKKLRFFSNLSDVTGAHLLFIHHQNKGTANYTSGSGQGSLGSQAIVGSVDCYMTLDNKGTHPTERYFNAKGRAIDDFNKIVLAFNKQSNTYFKIEDGEF